MPPRGSQAILSGEIAAHKDTIADSISAYHKILSAYDETEVQTELVLLNNIEAVVKEYETLTDQLMDQLDTG